MANDETLDPQTQAAEEAAPAGETAAEKFSRIGSKRLQNVLDAMRVLRNCAGPGYEYTEAQVQAIDKYIKDEHAKLMAAFRGETIVEKRPNLL